MKENWATKVAGVFWVGSGVFWIGRGVFDLMGGLTLKNMLVSAACLVVGSIFIWIGHFHSG